MKQAMEMADYKGPEQKIAFLEAMESIEGFEASNEFPQGEKVFNGKTHQAFAHQNISKVTDGKLEVVYRTSIEETLYEDETDYTQMSF